jgi:heat-inducible transcriptional repressor
VTLDSRKGRILQAIVTDYVETAEPIGSEWLVSHYDFGCKSATLRNEMAEMSELGYLVQPHTSAGRIPSTRGYRYYVDCLMPTPRTTGATDKKLSGAAGRMEIEEIVQLTCRTLSDMTQYPSVATTPLVHSNNLHRIFLTPASSRHVLLVMLFSTGHVEHRMMEVKTAPGDAALQRVTNYLNNMLAGKELDELARHSLGTIAVELGADHSLLSAVHSNLVAVALDLAENKVFLEGTNHILRQREFQDVLRLEQLLSVLEQQSVLFQVFSRALLGEEVTVLIGTESSVEVMADCSIVTSPYRIGGRTGGFIGVVGPTRMNYDRAVSAVGLMARSLSNLLTRASLE